MKIFGYIFMIGIVAGIFACIYFALFDGVINQNSWWLILLAIGLVVLNVFLYLDLKRRLVYIDGNIIGSVGTLKTIEYDIKDIKGFNQDDKYLNIIPNLPNSKTIRVSNYIGDYNELVETLNEILPNLDFIELEESFDELLNDERLGHDEIERIDNLNNLKEISKITNIVSIGSAILFFVYPKFYLEQFILCSIIPIAIIFIFKKYNGLIRIEEIKNDAYPSVFFGLFLSMIVLFIRGLLDVNIFDYKNFWYNLAVLSLVLLVAFYLVIHNVPTNASKKLILLVAAILTTLYTTGLITISNYLFDHSKPTIYYSKIIDKHISSGKHVSYYLKPEKWATQNESEDVSVSKEQYQNTQVGDSIEIYFYKGMLNIPYFEVEKRN